MNSVAVRRPRDEDELAAALALRERVFCGEQGVSLEAERDGHDSEGAHLVAVDRGRIVATCRLLIQRDVVRLSRMAVEPKFRRRGLGTSILAAAEDWSLHAGAQRITLHAQLPVRSLYEGLGYEARGRPFVEEGIEHVLMEKAIA